jgi:competence protein ComEA
VGIISKNDGKVNINTANETELTTLPGIGPATAQKIIDYRTTSGPFKSIEEIKNVSGIGDKKFEQLKDKIKVK